MITFLGFYATYIFFAQTATLNAICYAFDLSAKLFISNSNNFGKFILSFFIRNSFLNTSTMLLFSLHIEQLSPSQTSSHQEHIIRKTKSEN